MGLASSILDQAIHLSLAGSDDDLQAQLIDKDEPNKVFSRPELNRRATKACSLTSQCNGQPIPAYSHQYCDPKTKLCSFRCNSGYTLNGYTQLCIKNKLTTTTKTLSVTKTTTTVATPTIKLTSNKKGLGYNTALYLKPYTNAHSLSWAYNWANSETHDNQPLLSSQVEFVPMLWGKDSSGWTSSINKAIQTGSKHVLGFNEPDLISQSNISPKEAAELWKLNIQPLKGKLRLISPAITNGPPPNMGTGWLDQWITACKGQCSFDAVAIHWYDSATNVAYFKNYLTDIYKKHKKPIWLTEFAASGTQQQQVEFFKMVLPWLEQSNFIEKYAAFGAFSGTFVNSDGSLTTLGKAYRDIV
ncbi:hypothetical protein OIO90_001668 [Microbotryomycetes sp. JL221]|nr:hypothetical protein OIO90_001668 [Microbotryomycetes sp. JL221]